MTTNEGMMLVADILQTTVSQRRWQRRMGVRLIPFRLVVIDTRYGAVTLKREEVGANWPDKAALIALLEAKMAEASELVRTRGRNRKEAQAIAA